MPPGARARLGTVRLRHAAAVSHVLFARDGKTVVTFGGGDYCAWDATTGRPLRRLAAPAGGVEFVALSPDGKSLASGSADTSILVWDLYAPSVAEGKRAATPADLDRPWTELADRDAGAAYGAVRALLAVPTKSVPLLRERLRPVPTPDRARLERLVRDLDSDDFEVRDRADGELAKARKGAEPLLRRVLAGKPSPECRRRLRHLLERVEADAASPAGLRRQRAVGVLEQAGTRPAWQVLEALAKGAPDARLTRDAQAALQRIRRLSPKSP